jgi:hypothetical protein
LEYLCENLLYGFHTIFKMLLTVLTMIEGLIFFVIYIDVRKLEC